MPLSVYASITSYRRMRLEGLRLRTRKARFRFGAVRKEIVQLGFCGGSKAGRASRYLGASNLGACHVTSSTLYLCTVHSHNSQCALVARTFSISAASSCWTTTQTTHRMPCRGIYPTRIRPRAKTDAPASMSRWMHCPAQRGARPWQDTGIRPNSTSEAPGAATSRAINAPIARLPAETGKATGLASQYLSTASRIPPVDRHLSSLA